MKEITATLDGYSGKTDLAKQANSFVSESKLATPSHKRPFDTLGVPKSMPKVYREMPSRYLDETVRAPDYNDSQILQRHQLLLAETRHKKFVSLGESLLQSN